MSMPEGAAPTDELLTELRWDLGGDTVGKMGQSDDACAELTRVRSLLGTYVRVCASGATMRERGGGGAERRPSVRLYVQEGEIYL